MNQVSPGSIVAKLEEFFRENGRGIASVYLFGSVARGTARGDSDVDVAVLFERDPPPTLEGLHFDLAHQLEDVLGRVVDLVVLNHASADLAHRVLGDALIVCDRDRSARIRFEVRTRNEYFDLEPILNRYRRPGRTK